MTRRAAKVDANQAEIVAALEAAGASVLSLAALGNGAPDLLAGWAGAEMVLLEVKHPARAKGRREPNALQTKWHGAWKGRPVAVVLTPEDALRAIGATA